MPETRVKFLNHASVVIQSGPIALLCDPWFKGTCFRNGWGLRFDNPDAFLDARECTHLWISHFHGDHLHLPTLKELASSRPDLTCLVNVSANFSMIPAIRSAGFRHITPLDERRCVSLAPGFDITRFPSTGIDNMLVVRTPDVTVLEFNDCNLPVPAIRALMRKIGPVDVLLTNFNHANKLLGAGTDAEIKDGLRGRFGRVCEAVNPRFVIPFASMHYYRAPHTRHQNDSMLTPRDLTEGNDRVTVLDMGDEAVFESGAKPRIQRRTPPVSRTVWTQKDHTPVAWEELVGAGRKFGTAIRKGFLGLTGWIPSLRIWIEDHARPAIFQVRHGLRPGTGSEKDADIALHSQALFEWFGTPYGTDAFFVGGDFRAVSSDFKPVNRLTLAGELVENGLAPRQALKLLLTPAGWRFFFNRREEIAAVLASGRFAAGNRS